MQCNEGRLGVMCEISFITEFSLLLEEAKLALDNWQSRPGSNGPAMRRRRIHTTALSKGSPEIQIQ